MATIVLIHGGFYPEMDADRFWIQPGIAKALAQCGHDVLAPNRLSVSPSWDAETAYLLETLPSSPVHVFGASNGASVAARLAIEHPERIASITLAWPATAGVKEVDEYSKHALAKSGVPDPSLLLSGGTLRGVLNAELALLKHKSAVIAADPPDFAHRQITVDQLLAKVPGMSGLGAFPVPFAPHFPSKLDEFVTAIDDFLK
ncbi:MAG: alpha/beta fold hydrolase [Pseudomonadota bacterium]